MNTSPSSLTRAEHLRELRRRIQACSYVVDPVLVAEAVLRSGLAFEPGER